MLFPTVTFAVFFTVVLLGAWLLVERRRPWQVLLLAASLVFAWAWDRRLPVVLLTLILANWVLGQSVARAPSPTVRRVALWTGIAVDVGVLAWFKYYGFFVTSASNALADLGLTWHPPVVEVIAPLGLSFLTFEAIAYLVELRRKVIRPLPLVELALCLSFFPIAAAGPITRPSELAPQLATPPDPARVEATRAFALLGRGLFKTVVLSSFLATGLSVSVLATPELHSSPEILVGIYAYAAMIYADFSGYSDLAIGLSLLLGLRIPENFDRPYTAVSPQDFWTRWHQTLTRWFRDVVFTPMALRASRTGRAGYGAILVTWLATGLWHGASWTFVTWGLLWGVTLCVQRALRLRLRAAGRPRPASSPARTALYRFLTFQLVCLGWLLFGSESLGQAGRVLRRLLTAWGSAPAVTPTLLLAIAVTIAAQYVPVERARRVVWALGELALPVQVVLFAFGLVVIGALGPEGVPPFVYFRF